MRKPTLFAICRFFGPTSGLISGRNSGLISGRNSGLISGRNSGPNSGRNSGPFFGPFFRFSGGVPRAFFRGSNSGRFRGVLPGAEIPRFPALLGRGVFRGWKLGGFRGSSGAQRPRIHSCTLTACLHAFHHIRQHTLLHVYCVVAVDSCTTLLHHVILVVVVHAQ